MFSLSAAALPGRPSPRCWRKRAGTSSCSKKIDFPRFHIGESLLPLNLPLFERLGVADEVERIGVYKPGAEVISDDHAQRGDIPF